MAIGIICAMNEEIKLIKEDMQITQIVNIAKREVYLGTLYGKEVVLVLSRIGKVAAATTATMLVTKFDVKSIIFAGTAGGVDPCMNVGDVVVADLSAQHDFFVPQRPSFEIPLIDVSYFKSNKEMNEIAIQAVKEYVGNEMVSDIPQEYLDKFKITSPKVEVGTIASGDQFISTKEKNEWLYKEVENCKCVEMEGAAVAQVCYEFDVPFTIIRVISDCANDSASIDFDLFVEKAACHFTRGTIKAFIKNY